MSIDEKIAVLQAIRDGRTIELSRIDRNEWRPYCGNGDIDTYTWNYRVKPEPREWWLSSSLVAFHSEEAAIFDSRGHLANYPVHVREVL